MCVALAEPIPQLCASPAIVAEGRPITVGFLSGPKLRKRFAPFPPKQSDLSSYHGGVTTSRTLLNFVFNLVQFFKVFYTLERHRCIILAGGSSEAELVLFGEKFDAAISSRRRVYLNLVRSGQQFLSRETSDLESIIKLKITSRHFFKGLQRDSKADASALRKTDAVQPPNAERSRRTC